jgi:hypothetical protein
VLVIFAAATAALLVAINTTGQPRGSVFADCFTVMVPKRPAIFFSVRRNHKFVCICIIIYLRLAVITVNVLTVLVCFILFYRI